jgi:hypothetical protein
MTLLKNIITLVNESVHELAQWIEQTYEIDANEIISKWEEISRNSGAGIAKTGKPGKAQHVNGDLDPTLCQHTFLVGNNAGMQCGVKPKDGPLCGSHKPKSRASSNEKTVDIVGALNPIYCNFEVGEGKQCGVKPKDGLRCSVHRNGAPKIKTVPLVNGVVDPVFCNRKLSETTQCGVKPKAGNYCSSHRGKTPSSSKTPSESEGETRTRTQTKKSEKKSEKKSKPSPRSRKLKKSEPETNSDETDEEPRRLTRSQAKAKQREPESSEESEISESDDENDDELLKDAISRAGK